MRHKVRDLGVFFCLALMLFTVTSCGKEVSDQTIAATEQSSEESRAAEAVMGTETVETFSMEKAGWFCMQTLWRQQEKLSANSVAVRMESRALFVMARV